MKTYVCHTDAGHGWIAVKRKELIRLGIIDEISHFSYQRGDTVYLEEDADATLFFNAKEALGEEVPMRTSYQEYSRIRGYDSFSKVDLKSVSQKLINSFGPVYSKLSN